MVAYGVVVSVNSSAASGIRVVRRVDVDNGIRIQLQAWQTLDSVTLHHRA